MSFIIAKNNTAQILRRILYHITDIEALNINTYYVEVLFT